MAKPGKLRLGFALSILGSSSAVLAGGLISYEVGTADVGLASAGYSARSQDPTTVLTNPAGMTRLQGTQILLGAQALYGDVEFSRKAGTSRELGTDEGGNAVGWFPGGGLFITHQISPEITLGFASTGNFGASLDYDNDWVGRYRVQETTLLGMSLLPSIAYKVNEKLSVGASLNVMYGVLKDQVAVNNVRFGYGDGKLKYDDYKWGTGFNLGLLYEVDQATRLGVTYNSQVDLDFSAKPKFSGLAPGLERLLNRQGLLNATLDMGIKVPQGADASLFHQLNERWALLGSIGWQQWSEFGRVNLGIEDNRNPTSLTTDLDFKDTWHAALGAQYRIDRSQLLNFGVAYDSNFQHSNDVSPILPTNQAWRFGVGLQNQPSKVFEWGLAAEYLYGGSQDVNQQGAPVVAGGRGNLVGSYDPNVYFLSANFIWKY